MPSKKMRKKLEKMNKIKQDYGEYSRNEKFEEINKIQEKLVELGLGTYEDEMNKFDHMCHDMKN